MPTRGIVGLFDLDTATVGHSTRNFLKTEESDQSVSAELRRGLCLKIPAGEDRVWLTALPGDIERKV